MSNYRRVELADIESFLDRVSRRKSLIETLSTGEDRVVRDAMRSLGFYQETETVAKVDLMGGGMIFEFIEEEDEDLLESMSVFDNMVDTEESLKGWGEGLKFMTVTAIRDPDDWFWVVVDLQIIYPGNSESQIQHDGNIGWRCDSIYGLIGLLASAEFRAWVDEWHGNYRRRN